VTGVQTCALPISEFCAIILLGFGVSNLRNGTTDCDVENPCMG
jgi:hypothetical protein